MTSQEGYRLNVLKRSKLALAKTQSTDVAKYRDERINVVTAKTVRHELNRTREQRTEMEIVVDAYNSDERAMGWYYYLEEKLAVLFQARVHHELPVSPLTKGDEVEVLGIAPYEVCSADMYVWVRQPKRNLAVPLSQLVPLGGDKTINEAIADWHYWLSQGYQF